MQRLDAVGDRELREALLFARAQPFPVTADELAAAHRVHRNVARSRLERLTEVGLLVPAFERRTGRTGPGAGRPAKTYRVAPELSAIEFPERRYEQLVGLIVDALPKRGLDARLHELGGAFGRKLAEEARLRSTGKFQTAVQRVCRALGGLGYHAAVVELSDDAAVVMTATCPLRPLVRAKPDLGRLDEGMWTALVTKAVQGADPSEIVCETGPCCQSERKDCRVRIRRQQRRRPRLSDD
jgi:predicted ArsR family transcriptional regulator